MITIELILKIVCDILNVDPEEVTLPSYTKGAKKGSVARARQLVMYYAYKNDAGGEETIGVFFSRHHSSVNHAKRTVLNDYETSQIMRDICFKIESEINYMKDSLKIQAYAINGFYEAFAN